MTDPTASRIARTFDRTFLASHRTFMVGGGAEPLYQPGDAYTPARIRFTRDFPASALHEAAHWCLAGAQRRTRRDYGYWYEPGPRDARTRAAFFAAECNVQAVEASFAEVCGVRFVVSADDFAAPHDALEAFERSVAHRIGELHARGLPPRAAAFRAALLREFVDG